MSILSNETIITVAAGETSSYIVTDKGNVYVCGSCMYGMCGRNSTDSLDYFTLIDGLKNV